jgi:hypothetical protein
MQCLSTHRFEVVRGLSTSAVAAVAYGAAYKTEAVYRRYAIVSKGDLRFAVQRSIVTRPVTLSRINGKLPDSARRIPRKTLDGEMAEWSMAVVLKTTVPGRVPGVRIPLSPPFDSGPFRTHG